MLVPRVVFALAAVSIRPGDTDCEIDVLFHFSQN